MHWRLKGLVQKALGVMPAGDRLHYRLQRGFGGLQDFSRELAVKVEDWQIMIGHLRSAGIAMDRTRFFEIGTGWYPTFPFALYRRAGVQIRQALLRRRRSCRSFRHEDGHPAAPVAFDDAQGWSKDRHG